MSAKILVFAGSLRRDSFNKKLARLAEKVVVTAGAEATFIDLADFPLPIFDEDIEKAGTPDEAVRLKKLFLDHDALIICSPEYNSSITAALKNAIDWVSRRAPDEASLAAFQGKIALLLAASPGALGGLRGLVHLRSILGNIGVIVLPGQYALAQAHLAFDDQGALKDAKVGGTISNLVQQLVTTTTKLKSK
jgi:NAD(P)H-dependent FMN reductase